MKGFSRLRRNMGLALVDLLGIIGAELDARDEPEMPGGSLRWLGRLSLSPRLLHDAGIRDGWNLWTSGPGWIPLDDLDVERWLVDAPDGDHLLICERDECSVRIEPKRQGSRIIMWDQRDYAALVGRAVLDGRLELDSPSAVLAEHSESAETTEQPADDKPPLPPEGGDLALSPTIDVAGLMLDRGRMGIALQPVLLQAHLWIVEGDLSGPDGDDESGRWWILHDPFSKSYEKMQPKEFLRQVPNIQRISSQVISDEAVIRHRISNLIDERRPEMVTSEASGQSASAGLLRWWRLEVEHARLRRHDILLPAWAATIPLEGRRLIHGLSGLELPFEGD